MSLTQLEVLSIVLGALSYCIGAIWVTVLAFRKGFMWGLCCLMFPPMTFLYVILYHPDTRIPIALKLWGVVLILGGAWGVTHRQALTTSDPPRVGLKIRKRPDWASRHQSPDPSPPSPPR